MPNSSPTENKIKTSFVCTTLWNNYTLLLQSGIVECVCVHDCVPAHMSTFRDVRMYLGSRTFFGFFCIFAATTTTTDLK